jgi:hypothetical protein
MTKSHTASASAGFARLRKFGWGPKEAWDAIGPPNESRPKQRLSDGMSEAQAAESLLTYSREFADFLLRHPEKVHVFPMVGAILPYKFAQGMASVLNPGTLLWAPVTDREKRYCGLRLESRQLNQIRKKGAVMHDYFQTHTTRDDIAEAAGVAKDSIVMHRLHPFEVGAPKFIVLPRTGRVVSLAPDSMFSKGLKYGYPHLKRVSPHESSMTHQERKLVRDAVYESGVAAAELLNEHRK